MKFTDLINKNFTKLQREKQRVDKEIHTIDSSTRYQDDNTSLEDVEIESKVDDLEIKAENKSIKDNLIAYRDQIQRALHIMSKKKYGICENCEKPIDPKRLEADPSAIYCLSCAEKLEKMHGEA